MKMCKSYPKRVENTVGKGEIARDEQFLLSHSVFKKTCPADRSKQGLVLKRVNFLNEHHLEMDPISSMLLHNLVTSDNIKCFAEIALFKVILRFFLLV